MADISKIKTPDGTTYDIKDSTARANSGVTGVKGNAESAYRKGNVNLTAANVGAVATTGNETVAGNKNFSGTTTITQDSIYNAPTNTVVKANSAAIIQSPVPKYLWHDLFAFCRVTTPKFYTSTNGTTWTTATLEKRLFSHQEAWGSIYALSSTIKGSRWEWDDGGLAWCGGAWLVIGVAYANPIASFDVLLEHSSGTGESATWTSICDAKNITANAIPIWIKTDGPTTNNIRLTITRNASSASDAVSLPIVSIRWLTARWGNQGKGSEFEHPYTWDSDFNLYPLSGAKFVGNLTGNATNVTGVVAVANGGTGKTTTQAAANNLLGGLDNTAAQSTAPTDDTSFITTNTTGATGTYYHRKASLLWTYIKGKIESLVLSTSTSSTSTTTAATSSAVKTAYDLANTANTTANTALSGVNGNLIYDQTFTISNGTATFTPHVYQKGQEVTTNYAKSCFAWKYRLIDGTEVALTTLDNRGCTVTITDMGYGGHVIGIFTPS